MAQQTAVEWLWDLSLTKELSASDFEQANKMFEQQIIKAVDVGFDEGSKLIENIKLGSGEQYYTQTYGK
jgi:hypothetical protein